MFWFAVAAIGLRWLTISTRSDWFGGWGVGPRHLVPVIPVAMLGFAAALERVAQWRAGWRRLWWSGLAVSVLVALHLALHSIFEWMWLLVADPRVGSRGVMSVSHWEAWASPLVGYFAIKLDVLAVGAVLLARLGHPGLLIGFGVVAVIGAVAGWRVLRALRA